MPNEKPVNGQPRPNSILDQLEPPQARKVKQRLAKLRTAWQESWQEGGFLPHRARRVPHRLAADPPDPLRPAAVVGRPPAQHPHRPLT